MFLKTKEEKERRWKLMRRDDKFDGTQLPRVFDRIKLSQFLLRRGCDDEAMGWCAALDRELKDRYDGHDAAKLFFELNDQLGQTVEIEARDNEGRTPLQWAVARFLPKTVDVLLDRGADLSNFVFPSSMHYFGPGEWAPTLSLAAGALACVERLQKRGYELDRDDALTIMKFFSKRKLFKMSADLAENWYDDQEFAEEAKEIMVKPSLSLYDLVRLRPGRAAKILAYQDYYDFACSIDVWPKLPRGYRDACAVHLCEQLSRRFCQLWTLDAFWKLIHYRLPVEPEDDNLKKLMIPVQDEELPNLTPLQRAIDQELRRAKQVKLLKQISVHDFCMSDVDECFYLSPAELWWRWELSARERIRGCYASRRLTIRVYSSGTYNGCVCKLGQGASETHELVRARRGGETQSERDKTRVREKQLSRAPVRMIDDRIFNDSPGFRIGRDCERDESRERAL
ncbi:unnamed protein product [Trichogramma brassicae]|uniref:Uncharacterized protein n=1 Tax=Trichogramma brassicae TaxID=86971 RepID=A0A6H5ILZ7_9HYME|nr:unnamed protein product [Trichogramma brassicae]